VEGEPHVNSKRTILQVFVNCFYAGYALQVSVNIVSADELVNNQLDMVVKNLLI